MRLPAYWSGETPSRYRYVWGMHPVSLLLLPRHAFIAVCDVACGPPTDPPRYEDRQKEREEREKSRAEENAIISGEVGVAEPFSGEVCAAGWHAG